MSDYPNQFIVTVDLNGYGVGFVIVDLWDKIGKLIEEEYPGAYLLDVENHDG